MNCVWGWQYYFEGQSFGAFLAHGVTLELEGDANDYIGKVPHDVFSFLFYEILLFEDLVA